MKEKKLRAEGNKLEKINNDDDGMDTPVLMACTVKPHGGSGSKADHLDPPGLIPKKTTVEGYSSLVHSHKIKKQGLDSN